MTKKQIWIGVGVFAVWWSLSFWSKHWGPESEKPLPVEEKPAEPEISDDEKAGLLAIRVAKADVPRQLKDPESAQFRDLFAVKTPKGGYLVCGELNSKNSFGAKTGYSKFIYNTTVTIFEEQMPADTFRQAWTGSCLTWTRIASRPT